MVMDETAQTQTRVVKLVKDETTQTKVMKEVRGSSCGNIHF